MWNQQNLSRGLNLNFGSNSLNSAFGYVIELSLVLIVTFSLKLTRALMLQRL